MRRLVDPDKVQILRLRAGLSLDDLAARAHLNRATIWRVETGRSTPTIATVRALAAGLGIPLTDLLDLNQEKRSA